MRQVAANSSASPVFGRGSLAYALASAFVIVLVVPEFALAYVDPSVVTYAVQAIAGVAVAISAVVGVAFRKVRSRLFDLLGIDPEGKKEKDREYRAFDDEYDDAVSMTPDEAFVHAGGSLAADGAPGGKSANRRRHAAAEPKKAGLAWPVRFAFAALVSLLTVGTLLVVAPVELVAGSPSDFFFEPIDIAAAAMPKAFIIIAAVALLLSMVRGRAFTYALAIVFALGVGFYVQAMFLNTGLPIADGTAVEWAQFDDMALLSTIVWALLIAGCLVLVHFRERLARGIMPLVALVLVIVQGAGVFAIVTGSDFLDVDTQSSRILSTQEGLFEVSSKNNVIVFVLDTYDTSYLQKALVDYPDLLDDLEGFTWYENSTGSLIPTRYALPYLLTGQYPRKGDSWETYLKSRYSRSTYLYDLKASGYSVGLYTNDTHWEYVEDEEEREALRETTVNMRHGRDIAEMDSDAAFTSLAGCAFYRDFPWVFKPRFRFNTTDVKNSMLVYSEDYIPEKMAYVYDDAQYFKRLKQMGLTKTNDGSKGYFHLIHLFGPHYPNTLDENGNRVEESSVTAQSAGSLRIVKYYLEQMKKLGVYDSATIIITADHGQYYVTGMKDIKEPTTPIILAKPPLTEETVDMPLQISDAPVTQGDILATVLQAVGTSSAKYDGKSLFSYTGEEDPYRPRYYYATQESKVDYKDRRVVEWCIEGNVLDFDNWSKTGKTFDADLRYLEEEDDGEK